MALLTPRPIHRIMFKVEILMESYRHIRNKVNLLNRTLRTKYYSDQIQENVANLR